MLRQVLVKMKDDVAIGVEVIAQVLLLVIVVIFGSCLLAFVVAVIWWFGQFPAWPFLIIIAVMGWLWLAERRTRPISHWKP